MLFARRNPVLSKAADTSPALRARAEALAAGLPALLLAAERLAATLGPGSHRQRRVGTGDEFWQYRPASATDGPRGIDWRRSARSDATFVREREQVASRTAWFWIDPAPGMAWASDAAHPQKYDRAALLALALGVVLSRAGEQIAAPGDPASSGRRAVERLAASLTRPGGASVPDLSAMRAGHHLIVVSDFFGEPSEWDKVFARAASQGVGGVALQLLDPAEEGFPYAGALRFQPVGEGAPYETRDAAHLAAAYRDALAERRAKIAASAGAAGWVFGHDTTQAAPAATLGWLYAALAG